MFQVKEINIPFFDEIRQIFFLIISLNSIFKFTCQRIDKAYDFRPCVCMADDVNKGMHGSVIKNEAYLHKIHECQDD